MVSSSSTIPTPATPDVCTVKLLSDGEELPGTVHLSSIVVSKEVNRVPSATIQVEDGEASAGTFAVSNGSFFLPGKSIEIKLGYRAQEDTVFKGRVVKTGIKIRKSGSFLLVDCRDEAVKMTIRPKSRYLPDGKDSAILDDLIGQYSLQSEVTATTPDLKDVVQYEATDWDFMLCRAEANGMLVLVDDGKVTVAPPDLGQAPVVSVAFGSTVLELDAEIDARLQSSGIESFSWNATDGEVIQAEAAEPQTTETGNLSPATLADVIGGDPSALRHGGNLIPPELQAWADGVLLRERLAKVRGRARFQGLATVKPGKLIELQGVGERMQGKVFVSGVRHQFAGGNWETDVQFGLSTEPFAQTYNLRPMPAAGLIPAVSGLHTGVVTKLEGDPDGEDRIKVRLPLVSSAEEGVWARIATLDAGKERGTYFRPEIGDEVILGFLHDDPRFPVVLGMCHSSRNPAPVPPSDDNHQKGYVSREKLKLTFDDEKKVIALETPAGNKLTLSEEDKTISLADQNGNTIKMNADGITVETGKKLVLKATGDVEIEGQNVKLKAMMGLKAEGNSSAELSSGATTTLKGGATTVIQGGIVQIN